MAGFLHDLRLGVRSLRKTPFLATAAVLLLALGIGSTTAIFTVIDAVMLRPIGIPEPRRVVQVWENLPSFEPDEEVQIPVLNFEDYESKNRVFDLLAAIGRTTVFRLKGESAQRTTMHVVSSDLFRILGIQPILGRAFDVTEDRPGGPPVVLLSHHLWQNEYGGDADVVGRTIPVREFHPGRGWLEGSLEIVGVLGEDYRLPPLKIGRGVRRFGSPDLVAPLGSWRWGRNNRGMQALRSLARLAPGVGVEQAQADLTSIAAGIADLSPQTHAGYRVFVTPLSSLMRRVYGPRLYLLWGAAGFVLVLACANVASLLFGRSIAREREFAVRAALGAGRSRLMALLLGEGAALAGLGSLAGLGLAAIGQRFLVTLVPGGVPGLDEVALDIRAFAFSAIVAAVATLLCGLPPALRNSRPEVGIALRSSGRGSFGGQLRPLRWLVIAEAAITLLLLVGAGLMSSSFVQYLRVDPGFERDRLLSLQLRRPPRELSKYKDRRASARLFDELRSRLEALPEVFRVVGSNVVPLSGFGGVGDITLADRPPPPPADRPLAVWLRVSPGYFETLEIELVAGRTFTDADVETWLRTKDGPPAASPEDMAALGRALMRTSIPVVINRTFARRFWLNESALGKRFYWGTQQPNTVLEGSYDDGTWDVRYPPPTPLEIVGVVGDVKLVGLDAESRLQYYTPQKLPETLLLRATLDSDSLLETIRRTAISVDPAELEVVRISTMDERFSEAVAVPRFQMLLVGFFAVCSVLMAAGGLFGVMTYAVHRRTQEIGIRVALGAKPLDIRMLVLGEGVLLTSIGLALGVVAALGLTRVLESQLFGVSASDPTVFIGGSAFLLLVALAACFFPARRATGLDPMVALRED